MWKSSVTIYLAVMISSGFLFGHSFGVIHCAGSQVNCDVDKCIPMQWVCDGEIDCHDKTDERDCGEAKNCTSTDDFQCHDGHHCIASRWTCDGEFDCLDKSDELTCATIECDEDHVQCGVGLLCIHQSFLCDGHVDCPGGYDELPSTCSSNPCAENEFRCTEAHQCISKRWQCDGDADCPSIDGKVSSDENNCPSVKCEDDHWQCNNTQCIPLAWRCDGGFDCSDHTDESNCPIDEHKLNHCSKDEFECRVSLDCVHQSWKCDGDIDCMDGSDEASCPPVTCAVGMFQCKLNGNCIPSLWQCDGKNQCEDNSDELGCGEIATAKCDTVTEFDCNPHSNAFHTCIPVSQVCNGANDCGGNEDEDAVLCSRNKTNDCSGEYNGGCMHTCISTPVRSYCSCHLGYQLAADGKSCDDIDECETPGRCSQLCQNLKGQFKCSCSTGYELDIMDHVTCHAKGADPLLFFSNRHDIREINVRTNHYRPIVEGLRTVKAFDYDVRNGALFWSDAGNIYRASNLSQPSGHRETLISSNLPSVNGLAFDWVNFNLFWTDGQLGVVSVANVPSSAGVTSWIRTLFQHRDQPKAIVLDPRDDRRVLFWTECGNTPRIVRAPMDGSSEGRDFVQSGTNIVMPTGLTIDFQADLLYWVDAKLHVISSVRMWGTGAEGQVRKLMTSYSYLRHPFAVANFEDSIYWTDWQTESVFRASKSQLSFSSSVRGARISSSSSLINVTKVISRLSSPTDIHVYHLLSQPTGKNVCASNPCSHLCLPRVSPPSYTCLCPDSTGTVKYTLVEGNHCTKSTAVPLPTVLPVVDSSSTLPVTDTKENNSASGSATGGSSLSLILGISFAVVAIVVLIIAFVLVRRYRRLMSRKTMNFDNPMYRKRTEDQFSLAKNMQPMNVDNRLTPMLEPLSQDTDYNYVITRDR